MKPLFFSSLTSLRALPFLGLCLSAAQTFTRKTSFLPLPSRLLKGTLLSAVLFSGVAVAAGPTSDTITWTPPTQYDDGSAIAVGEITEYVIRWGCTLGGPYSNVIRVPATPLTVDVPRTSPYVGRRCYVVTAVAGLESDYSAEICKTVKKPKSPVLGVS